MTRLESVARYISYTALWSEATELNMYKLILVFVLASTLGADLSHLLEQLSQGERGEDYFTFNRRHYLGFYFYAFVLSWAFQ